jgi:hypothetical protein
MMTVGLFLVLYVVCATGVPIYLHFQEHGVFNLYQVSLAFFLPLNMLICIWEVSLGLNIDHIKLEYKALAKSWRRKEFACVIDFFNSPMSLKQLFNLRYWSRVWSTYSLYDPSYQNQESFGFFVDVSNGWCFFLPSALLLYAMTYDVDWLMSPRTLGCVGLVSCYAMLHGTCVYFLSFFFNGRQKRFGSFEVALFIGGSNGLWFVFPLIGMVACYSMIQTDTMACWRA